MSRLHVPSAPWRVLPTAHHIENVPTFGQKVPLRGRTRAPRRNAGGSLLRWDVLLNGEVALRVPVVEGVVHFGAFARDRDLVVVDVHNHLREQGAEQVLADMVWHAVEQLDGVREHVDIGEHQVGTVVEAVLGLRKLLLDRALLHGDLFEPFA